MGKAIRPADWQNVLKLLMLTMLADGRSYERQVDSFVNASVNLRSNMSVRGIQTREMTMNWYIQHLDELVDIHTGETFEKDLLSLIDSLETLPNKRPLIQTLKNLAKRDSERRDFELSVVAKSKERWA